MRSVASWCFRNKFIVIGCWVLALVLANVISAGAGTAYSNNFKLPNTESANAVKLLQRNAPKASGDTEQIVIGTKAGKVTDPGVRSQVQAVLARAAKAPDVTAVASPYANPKQISASGQIAYANVTFSVQNNNYTTSQSKAFVKSITRASKGGVQFQVEGQIAESADQQGGDASLGIGFLTAAIVLFLVFGSLAAMMLPLITAALSLGTGIAIVGLLTHVLTIANFADQLALLIGLGVGVDYALFILTRYRQGILRGLEPEEAVIQAVDTSGRAVLFAGTIVCIAMLGMFVLGVTFLYGVAIAAVVAVASTVIAALTLLPALISWFGKKVLRRKERKIAVGEAVTDTDESPIWTRWTGWLSAHPVPTAVVAAGIMIVLAIPFFGIRLGSVDAGSDPSSSTTRQAYELLVKGFGAGYTGPLQLVAQIDSKTQQAAFIKVVDEAKSAPNVVSVSQPHFLPGTNGHAAVALADVVPRGSPQAVSTTTLLNHLRDQVIPAAESNSGLHVLVGGDTAIFNDFATVLSNKLPLFVGIVVLLSFLLLMVVFRSIIVPLTAAVMNLLTAGAAFGVVTAVFQNGVGASLLGIPQTGPIESFLPVIVFPIVFGLSMDYEVFLISRIYEEWRRRGNNQEAVTHGLAATGQTITAAAAIMVLVFGAFILGGQIIIELFGVGLATAVLLDALIVRSILVPALMLIIGDRNWGLPPLLERLLPHINVEGSVAAEAALPAPT